MLCFHAVRRKCKEALYIWMGADDHVSVTSVCLQTEKRSSPSSGQVPFSHWPMQLLCMPQGVVVALWLNVHDCKDQVHWDWTFLVIHGHRSASVYTNILSNTGSVFIHSHVHGRPESDAAPRTQRRRNDVRLKEQALPTLDEGNHSSV